MKVIDASVVVIALTDKTRRGEAALTRMTGTGGHAPELVDIEVLSALRGRVAGGWLTASRARQAMGALEQLPLVRHRHSVLLPRMWELRHTVTAYDAAYVALAELRGAPLLTLDRSLARAPGLGCDVELLA